MVGKKKQSYLKMILTEFQDGHKVKLLHHYPVEQKAV